MTKEEIIEGCKSQNLRAQRLLYEQHSKRLYPICLRYCKDEQSASSALHNGFLKIYKYISSLDDFNKLVAWMNRIIVNASLDQLKADKKFSFVEISDEHFEHDDSVEKTGTVQDKYLPLLKLLPNGYRLVFSMRVLEEFSHKEIAQTLGITENTSRSQLMKARKMLKRIIDQKKILI